MSVGKELSLEIIGIKPQASTHLNVKSQPKQQITQVFLENFDCTIMLFYFPDNQGYMSRIVRKPDFYLCENKGADQLRSNCEADQRLCFRYMDITLLNNLDLLTFRFIFQTIKAIYDRTFPAEEYDNKDCDDNCGLMYLNEATLLNNLRIRYMKNKIYVSLLLVCF